MPHPDVIIVMGGTEAEPCHATVGDNVFRRDVDEDLPAFERRAVATARAAGAPVVVIGGLPAALVAAGVDVGEVRPLVQEVGHE